jgi:predicted nucleic acid-binding protein
VPIFLDTNILLYSISTTDEEAVKRARALQLLERDDCALSVQVLQEFYVQATRHSRVDALSHAVATGLIRTWLRFQVQENSVALLQEALEIKNSFGFSFWDSAVIAAARAIGCRELYSEDLSHGREIAGVRVVDPFR